MIWTVISVTERMVVGRNAQPIARDNVGHILLVKMGWSGTLFC